MRNRGSALTTGMVAVALALGVAVILLVAAGAAPFEALGSLVDGSVGSVTKLTDTVMAWVPLALAAAGLVVTFAAGLWNIGVEGQVIAGAIVATWAAREVPGPAWVVIPVVLVAGMVGGALWASFASVLRTHGHVNEIFGGLGLDFVAASIATYLIIGPWKRAGIASTSGTDLFRAEAWMPTVGDTRLSLIAPALALVAIGGIWWMMERTRSGLEMTAVGSNPASARLLGIDPNRTMLTAFLIGGALAGLAGAVLVSGFQHKLVPSVAGGRGFLGILVVLLAGNRAWRVVPIAAFFAAVSVGSSQLQLRFDLDSSLAGVLQGSLVLIFLLVTGWQHLRSRES